MEETTRVFMSDEAKQISTEIDEILSQPLATQNYMRFRDSMNSHIFFANIVCRNEEKIMVMQKRISLKWGVNGYYRGSAIKTGASYALSGPTAQRVQFWKRSTVETLPVELMDLLIEEVNPEAYIVMQDHNVKKIMTKGLFGRILAGKVKNPVEAMEYYIRYSLRGCGLKSTDADAMYSFVSLIKDKFMRRNAFVVAKDPNSLIEQFQFFMSPDKLVSVLNREGQRLVKLALQTNSKIDWVNPEFDTQIEANSLSKKERGIGELLEFWDGGPVLRQDSPVNDNFAF